MRSRLLCLSSILAVAILAGCASSGRPSTVLTPYFQNQHQVDLPFSFGPEVPTGPVVQVSPEVAVELVALGGSFDGVTHWWNPAGDPVQGISLGLSETDPGPSSEFRWVVVKVHGFARDEELGIMLTSPSNSTPVVLHRAPSEDGEVLLVFGTFFPKSETASADFIFSCDTRKTETEDVVYMVGEETKHYAIAPGARVVYRQTSISPQEHIVTRPISTGVSSVVSVTGPELLRSVAVTKDGAEHRAVEAAAVVGDHPDRAVWLAEFPGLAPGDIERIELRRPVMGEAVFSDVVLQP